MENSLKKLQLVLAFFHYMKIMGYTILHFLESEEWITPYIEIETKIQTIECGDLIVRNTFLKF